MAQDLLYNNPSLCRNLLASFRCNPYRDVLFVSEGMDWVTNREIKCLTEDVLENLGISWRLSGPQKIGFARQAVFYPSVYFLRRPQLYLLPKARIAFPYYHGYPDTQNPMMKKCYNNLKKYHHRVTRIQASHSYMRDIILDTGIEPSKVHLIPIATRGEFFSVADADKKAKARERYSIPQSGVVIGSFQKDGDGWGDGMTPKMVKGPDIFLKTVAILKDSLPELFILLSGPARGYVKKGLDELSVPYQHIYLEDYSEIGQLYNCLDVYMVTSRQEGGPKAILESLASGVPLVTTRVGQAMDMVKNEHNGMMIDVEDIEALADAVMKILSDSQLRQKMIQNGINTAAENTYSAHTPLWKEFFKGFIDS
ncbi:MAG: glycosyltransferase family 4 protein [Anaerohalosphaeraceae bacterium]|nr:glycosyltransferase family 4 protein [Anaerohalosphaeraceae bacterium]